MADVASKVAVIGSGISGVVCASILAKNGIPVTIFESARGPGGRMSQRREHSEDGSELLFDHGVPYFTVNAGNLEVQSLVDEWESRGLVAEWKEKFGSFDFISRKFVSIEEEGLNKRYVGVPGMNSICKALCHEPGVEIRFGCGIGRLGWLDDDDAWSLTSLDGQDVGRFKGVVASDKNTFSSRFTDLTGKPPPIELNFQVLIGEPAQIDSRDKLGETEISGDTFLGLREFGVIIQKFDFAFRNRLSNKRNSSFSLLCSYAGICTAPFVSKCVQIPTKGFSFKNSEILSWAYCDSSKPERLTTSERWVLHSTAKYAEHVISQTGFQKLSSAVLAEVAEELFQEFRSTGIEISQPFFKIAHRWGSAFPAVNIAGDGKCLWVGKRRLAICGDFCVMPNVEGAISSGIAAAAKFIKALSTE